MIDRENHILYIHIPKTGGSSIERYIAPSHVKFNWQEPDYNWLYGWCPKNKIHLQHASPEELLRYGLISEKEFQQCVKFAVTRNPWDRAISDWFWLQKDLSVSGSLMDFLNKEGAFKEYLQFPSIPSYRGDHLRPQTDYINDSYPLDYVGRFENFPEVEKFLESLPGNRETFNLHLKKSKKRKHYSQFFTRKERNLVYELYSSDIEKFNYYFENPTSWITRLKATLGLIKKG